MCLLQYWISDFNIFARIFLATAEVFFIIISIFLKASVPLVNMRPIGNFKIVPKCEYEYEYESLFVALWPCDELATCHG